MRELFYVILLVMGLIVGWFVKDWFADEKTEKVHMTLEQVTKQSKFNLVRDDFAEYFYLCEEKGLGINHWKALLLTGYTFQYGVDANNLSVTKVSADGVSPEVWKVEVSSVDVMSAELKAMKAFTLDKAWFKNAEERISSSKDELVKRKQALAKQRMYGDPTQKIYTLFEASVRETVVNLARALDKEIVIDSVSMPAVPGDWQQGLALDLTYQCGDITPVFGGDGALGDMMLESAPLDQVGLEVIELPVAEPAQ